PEPGGFDRFWGAYPRKVSKAQARSAWDKLQPDAALVGVILSALDRHKQTEQWRETKFIPYPATWLNGRRWEDEVEPSTTGRRDAEAEAAFGPTRYPTEEELQKMDTELQGGPSC